MIQPNLGGSPNGEDIPVAPKKASKVLNNNWVVATQICFFFIPKIGEDEPILTNIFQMG